MQTNLDNIIAKEQNQQYKISNQQQFMLDTIFKIAKLETRKYFFKVVTLVAISTMLILVQISNFDIIIEWWLDIQRTINSISNLGWQVLLISFNTLIASFGIAKALSR